MTPVPEACNFVKKESLAQVFSCDFCEISKNTFFYRTPLVAVSVISVISGFSMLNRLDQNANGG